MKQKKKQGLCCQLAAFLASEPQLFKGQKWPAYVEASQYSWAGFDLSSSSTSLIYHFPMFIFPIQVLMHPLAEKPLTATLRMASHWLFHQLYFVDQFISGQHLFSICLQIIEP